MQVRNLNKLSINNGLIIRKRVCCRTGPRRKHLNLYEVSNINTKIRFSKYFSRKHQSLSNISLIIKRVFIGSPVSIFQINNSRAAFGVRAPPLERVGCACQKPPKVDTSSTHLIHHSPSIVVFAPGFKLPVDESDSCRHPFCWLEETHFLTASFQKRPSSKRCVMGSRYCFGPL